MYEYENKYKDQQYIVGLDEVGRGCWAGPLVVAACILPKGYKNNDINDSKKLTEKKREELFDVIRRDCIEYSIVFISAKEVDKLNPKAASIYGMEQAIKLLKHKPDVCLIDAEHIKTDIKQESIIKGDAKSISIAAASILAKVSRDRYMIELGKKYPEFNFKKNKGYGTKDHVVALQKHSIIKGEHRESYKPIKAFIV